MRFMRYLVGSSLPALALWGCQHRADPAPLSPPAPPAAPTLLGEPWTLQREEIEVTPLDGSAASVQVIPSRTGLLNLRFADVQHVTLDVLLPSGATRYHLASTYDYYGQDLHFAKFYSRAAAAVIPRAMRVTHLSAHQLVLVETWQGPTAHYFTIQTYSR